MKGKCGLEVLGKDVLSEGVISNGFFNVLSFFYFLMTVFTTVRRLGVVTISVVINYVEMDLCLPKIEVVVS